MERDFTKPQEKNGEYTPNRKGVKTEGARARRETRSRGETRGGESDARHFGGGFR